MSDTDKPAPEFEKAPELFVEKPAVREPVVVATPAAAARAEQPPITTTPRAAPPPFAPSVPRPAPPPVVPRAASADPVDKAKAEREAKRQATIEAKQKRDAELDAIREAGRLERERDLAADEKAEAEAAEAEEAARVEAERQAEIEAAALKATVDRLLAERAVRVDREFAESEARRLEAEKDTDPSMGPQTVLDPRGPLARAARGGMARHMRGNVAVLDAALAAEVEKQPV